MSRRSHDWLFAFVLLVLSILALVALASGLHAEWKPKYEQADPAVRAWYSRQQLTDPAAERLGFKGCCDFSEVVRTQFRVDRSSGQDAWFYLKDGKWLPIPADIIHWGEHAPDGRPTLFVLGKNWDRMFNNTPAGTPTCFFLGEEGI